LKHNDLVDSISQALSYELPRYIQSLERMNHFYASIAFQHAIRQMADAKGRR